MSPEDPGLRLPDGTPVPMIRPDEAYKHVGKWRCANGSDSTGLQKLKNKLRHATRRMVRLNRKSASRQEAHRVGDALLGGLVVGYRGYCQFCYMAWQQTEEVEMRFRSVLNKVFRRDRSAPSAELYNDRVHSSAGANGGPTAGCTSGRPG